MFFKEEKYYLTKKGLDKLKKEYKILRELKSAKTKGETPQIYHSEDVDPEYLTFQEDLNFLEARIVETEHILKNIQLIRVPPKEKQNIINLGARVWVEVDSQQDEFEIVGTLEANPALGRISNKSPVGEALLGHKIGDEISISSPIQVVYKIKNIKYEVS